MDAVQYFNNAFEQQRTGSQHLSAFQQNNLDAFNKHGLPAIKHEEWKYTRVRNLFKDGLTYTPTLASTGLQFPLLKGTEEANRIVFINGVFHASLTHIIEAEGTLSVKALETAAGDEDAELVKAHLGHSNDYHNDGINALNGAFAAGGVFIHVKANAVLNQPVVIYHITDNINGHIFSQPRILGYVGANAQATIIETYHSTGKEETLSNEVIEICVAKDAHLQYIKLQDEGQHANHTGTTHIRQLEKAYTQAVTISLSGAVLRNNLNMIMEAEYGESHMYGLYLLNGNTQVDNHTIVDNQMPNCFSNELYKGIMDDSSAGIFNGKIFVRKDAQKTNAYQSNKNVLIGANASANTKPQLEIFADDVKCSHGCTIGKLDEEALFYLRARGISETNAKALLLHAFAGDILQQIKHEALRNHIDALISDRLSFQI